MAKFQSPLLGYNNNVRHKNRVFHIQTEDSGVGHPHIITHLFMDGGRILKSVKKSYAEHVGSEGMKETVRGLMKEQHKAIFIALRDGQFDALVDMGAAPTAKAAAPAAIAVAAVDVVVALSPAVGEASARASSAELEASPEPAAPPPSVELAPATIDETQRLRSILPPSTAKVGPEGAKAVRESPETKEYAPVGKNDLLLDFDAIEQAAQQDAASAPSLFHASELPPPPKNLFAKESATGAYRTVEANATASDPREEPASSGPLNKPQPVRAAKVRVPPSRPPGEARYAPARPAAIFGTTQRPPPASLFNDELVSDKSLDEVILSYLAEDLEPPRQK